MFSAYSKLFVLAITAAIIGFSGGELQAALQDCAGFVRRDREVRAICEGPNIATERTDPIGQCLGNIARQENSAAPTWAFPEGISMRNNSYLSESGAEQGSGRLFFIGIEGRENTVDSMRERLLRYHRVCGPAAARNTFTAESIKCCRVPASQAEPASQTGEAPPAGLNKGI